MRPRPSRLAARKLALLCAVSAGMCAWTGGWARTPAVMAAAARPQEVGRAKAKLAAGATALDAGDYGQALARFEEAFRLVPSPKIFFNFGLAYQGLGRSAEALDSFERFLSEAPDASAESRAEATRHAAALRPLVGSIDLSCDTEGADVTVDGAAVGATPLAKKLHASPGPHTVVVQRAGLPPFSRAVSLAAGAEVRLTVKLAAPASEPPGPTVSPLRAAAPPDPAGEGAAPSMLVTTPEPAPPSDHRKWLALGIAGALVVAVGVTVLLVFGASTTYPKANGTISGD